MNSVGQQKVGDRLSEDESRLVRLFRALPSNEQDRLLVQVGRTLMMRYCVDPLFDKYSNIGPREELAPESGEDFDERLLRALPYDWPGKGLINFDDLQDPGSALDEWFGTGDLADRFWGLSKHDSEWAKNFAEQYLEYANDNDVPTPTDFDATPEETLAHYAGEFEHFLREWRERVLRTIERQVKSKRENADAG